MRYFTGLVFPSVRLAQHWQALNEFEGDDYARVLTTARIDGAVTLCKMRASDRVHRAIRAT
jgi:hypothetical protein